MSQNDTFLAGEGDQWFNRNAHVLQPQRDEYVQLLKGQGISPMRVLEIGCANGFHLEALRRAFGCQACGIDPSQAAINEGSRQFPALQLNQGTARKLAAEDGAFDLVILGFCLYLCDREDLFRIAAEVDRVLADGGFVLIKDFCPPLPYRNNYGHKEGLFSFKMDYSRMFSWNPAYELVFLQRLAHADERRRYHPDEQIALQLLRKDLTAFALDKPYSD